MSANKHKVAHSAYKDKAEHFQKACGIEKARIKHLLKIQEDSAKHTFLTCIAIELVVEMYSAIFHDKHHDSPHHDSLHSYSHKHIIKYYKNCWESLTALDHNIRIDDLNLMTTNCSNMMPYTQPLGDILNSQPAQE